MAAVAQAEEGLTLEQQRELLVKHYTSEGMSPDQLLADELAQYYADPLGHAYFSYQWGTGQLAGVEGPRAWQEDFLGELGEEVAKRGFAGIIPVMPIRFATRSGHGPGKSALVGMLAAWIRDTRPFSKGVVTATTSPQLRSKTWAEITRWCGLSVTANWWHTTSSSSSMVIAHHAFKDVWRLDGQTCAEHNSEAFAGQHAASSTSYYIVDEGAGVPDKIYEVSEGGLTDGEPMIFVFGNPTRSRGRFNSCFSGPDRDRWVKRTIDTRDVPEATNKVLIDQWLEDWGEDSDFVRVRVKGLPPKGGELQLISHQVIENAATRPEPHVARHEPLILGVDVSRSARGKRKDGTAQEGAHRPAKTVMRYRRGRDARRFPVVTIRERARDTEYVADVLSKEIDKLHPDAVMVDGDGIGGPLVDMMHRRGYHQVHEIRGGSTPIEERYANLRTEVWHELEKWLREGGAIDNRDEDLKSDLSAPESAANRAGKEQLESKESMLERGIASPDDGDALALTFAFPVGPRGSNAGDGENPGHTSDYDPA